MSSAVLDMRAPVPQSPPAKDTMSPEKNTNGLTDVSKTGLPLPMLFVLVSALVAGLAAFYGLNAKQAQLETALSYERQMDDLREKVTEKNIQVESLRTSALMLSQDLARCNAPQRGR